jgi:hypothetical protein
MADVEFTDGPSETLSFGYQPRTTVAKSSDPKMIAFLLSRGIAKTPAQAHKILIASSIVVLIFAFIILIYFVFGIGRARPVERSYPRDLQLQLKTIS